MRMGNIERTGRAALAPMAGVTDAAYRRLCAQFGAAYTVTEMVSAKAIQYSYEKTSQLADTSGDERPVFLQLFGSDPFDFGLAARKAAAFGPDGIDINMGCPVPKVAGNGAGSALLKDPAKCAAIVAAVKRNTDLPVTVKIRAGWDKEHKNAVEVAKACEEAGAAAIAVHGRTRDQMYMGRADWDIIRQVKQAVQVPVIGNGDVVDAQSACQLLDATGCDMVLVGRGAMGNPWLFGQRAAAMAGGERPPAPPLARRLAVMRRHVRELCEDKGEYIGMREARSHAAWYLHGLWGAAALRRMCCGMERFEDLDAVIARVWEYQREEA